MDFPILKKVGSSFRVISVMSSIMHLVHDMDFKYAEELDRTNETTFPIPPGSAMNWVSKLTGDDILIIEHCLDEFGANFGFGIDFVISEAEFKIRVVKLVQDDDQPPIDGDDDSDPIAELENVDVVEAVSKPKAMGAHG